MECLSRSAMDTEEDVDKLMEELAGIMNDPEELCVGHGGELVVSDLLELILSELTELRVFWLFAAAPIRYGRPHTAAKI